MINLLPVGLTLSLRSRQSHPCGPVSLCARVSSFLQGVLCHVSWLEPGQAGLVEVTPLFLLSWVTQVGVHL